MSGGSFGYLYMADMMDEPERPCYDHDPHDPVILRPLEVHVADGKIEKAIRKLKRKIADDGVLRELKRRRGSPKPGDRRRKKRAAAKKRSQKNK